MFLVVQQSVAEGNTRNTVLCNLQQANNTACQMLCSAPAVAVQLLVFLSSVVVHLEET